MVIIKIIGGLGNQLFQYAAARSLAAMNHTEVKLDISGFEEYQLRNFDLSQFSFNKRIATLEEVKQYKAESTLKRIQSYLTPYNKRIFYKEPYFHFNPRFFKLSGHVYLQGFFQSEKYFLPAKNIIRKEFQLNPNAIENVLELGKVLQATQSIALHIRRGDYNDNATMQYHGIVPISYYQQAISIIKEKIKDPHFYIFSDDSQWAKDNLSIENATVVSGLHSKTHFEDLYLMSQCQHNIIANSSFSWWGAWLNTNANKIVIAPKRWFNLGPKDTQDLYANNWMQI